VTFFKVDTKEEMHH